jgi:hypothetical protein
MVQYRTESSLFNIEMYCMHQLKCLQEDRLLSEVQDFYEDRCPNSNFVHNKYSDVCCVCYRVFKNVDKNFHTYTMVSIIDANNKVVLILKHMFHSCYYNNYILWFCVNLPR